MSKQVIYLKWKGSKQKRYRKNVAKLKKYYKRKIKRYNKLMILLEDYDNIKDFIVVR